MRLRGDLQQRVRRDGNAPSNAAGTPYDGQVFSAWMLGCSLFVGNAAYLLLVWTFVIPPAWLGIVVSLCIYRTRRRVLLGTVGGVLMLWPPALQSL